MRYVNLYESQTERYFIVLSSFTIGKMKLGFFNNEHMVVHS